MLSEMMSHQERMFGLVTERINALGELQSKLADVRAKDVQTEGAEHRLAAYDEALHQLDDMRRRLDHDANEVRANREHMRLMAQWARPLENGYGYPTQFPKQCWDGFQAVLQYLPADERKAIRALELTEDETSMFNFVPPVEYDQETRRLDHAIAWMMLTLHYPKQGTALHNRFIDDVFPKIESALQTKETVYAASLRAEYADKLAVIDKLVSASPK